MLYISENCEILPAPLFADNGSDIRSAEFNGTPWPVTGDTLHSSTYVSVPASLKRSSLVLQAMYSSHFIMNKNLFAFLNFLCCNEENFFSNPQKLCSAFPFAVGVGESGDQTMLHVPGQRTGHNRATIVAKAVEIVLFHVRVESLHCKGKKTIFESISL